MISAADFVLFVHLPAHLLIPGNFLISLLSTAVQGELLAFGASSTVIGTVTGCSIPYDSVNSRSSTGMPLWRIIATLTPAIGDDGSPISSWPSIATSRSSTSKAI